MNDFLVCVFGVAVTLTPVTWATASEAGSPTGHEAATTSAQGPTTRADLLADLAETERAFTAKADDPNARLELAEQLLIAGDFWRAWEVVSPMVAAPGATPQVFRAVTK